MSDVRTAVMPDAELEKLWRRYRRACTSGTAPTLPVTRRTRFRRWLDRLLEG